MAYTTYLANKLLDHVLTNTAYTPPATVYFALLNADPTDAGSTASEAAGGPGPYARQAVTFAVAASKHTDNSGTITFLGMPADTWTHGAIMDDPTAGNMLFHGALFNPITTTSGQSIVFAIADIDAILG